MICGEPLSSTVAQTEVSTPTRTKTHTKKTKTLRVMQDGQERVYLDVRLQAAERGTTKLLQKHNMVTSCYRD